MALYEVDHGDKTFGRDAWSALESSIADPAPGATGLHLSMAGPSRSDRVGDRTTEAVQLQETVVIVTTMVDFVGQLSNQPEAIRALLEAVSSS
jgi:hypothetical protein